MASGAPDFMESIKSVVMPIRPRGSSAYTLTFARAAAVTASRVACRISLAALRAEHIGHRIVDAFAEPQQRLPSSPNAFQKLRQALDRVEHADGALPALEIARIERLISRDRIHHGGGLLRIARVLDRIVQPGEQLILIVVVEPLHLGRLQTLSEEVVDRTQQQRGIVGEFLRRIFAAARDDNGREIARTEVLLDEVSRVPADDRRPQRRHVQIVEHDDVDASRFDVAVRSHVGGDRPPAERKRRARLRPEARCTRTSGSSAACRPRRPRSRRR